MKIKDLLDAGFIIQERAHNTNAFSNIMDLKDLEVSDLVNKNYGTCECDVDYSSCEFDLWVEGEGDGGCISFSDFEEIMDNSETISEFMKKFTKKYY